MYRIDVPLQSVTRADGHAVAHGSPQTNVAFSPDSSCYASGGYDGRVVLWDAASREARWTRQHDRLVNAVRFSPSGELLASGGADKVCRIWRTKDGALVDVLARQLDDINALAWMGEERVVAVSQDGTGRIWNLRTRRLEHSALTHVDHCMSVDAGETGLIATCGEDATIRIWDASGNARAVLGQAGHAEMCRWSPDGTLLAASCDDGYVHVLDPDGVLKTRIGPYSAAVKSVAWSPDMRHLAVGAYDSTVRIWHRETGREVARWGGTHLWPRSLDWSADGKTLIVGSMSGAPEVLDVPELDRETAMAPCEVMPSSWTSGVSHLCTRGALIAVGTDGGRIGLWRDGTSLAALRVGGGSLVNTVALSEAAGTLIAYGNFAGRVGVVTADGDGRDLASILTSQPVNRVAWNPDGDRLYVADYEGVLHTYAWDGGELREISTYAGHDGAIKDVIWVDVDRLVTISTDRTAHLITAGGERLRSFGGHGELINSGSVGRIGAASVLATASRDRTIRLFDLETGALLSVLTGHDESVKAVAWHPGGEPLLLSGGYDFTARVWTLHPADWSLRSVSVLAAHTNAISSVGWSGDEPVTGGWDSRVLRWSPLPDGNGYAPHELVHDPLEMSK